MVLINEHNCKLSLYLRIRKRANSIMLCNGVELVQIHNEPREHVRATLLWYRRDLAFDTVSLYSKGQC